MNEINMLRTAIYGLNQYYKSGAYAENFDSKELADIVVNHAAAAGVSAMAVGILPGVGAIVASGIAVGAIWSMYIRIAAYLKLRFGKDTLKVIASAVVSNIITQLVGVLALELAFSFIPGAGIVTGGLVNFGITYMAGVIYLNTLTGIFAAGLRPDEMTDSQVKEQFDSASMNIDAKAAFNEAKNTFKQMKTDGSLEESGKKADINT